MEIYKHMNKICTDICQSKKLIELGVDVKTADMHYMYRHWEIDENTIGSQSDASIGFDSDFYCGADNSKTYHYIPAWSLTALFNMLPKSARLERGSSTELCRVTLPVELKCSDWYLDPIDAVFEIVCWLLKNDISLSFK